MKLFKKIGQWFHQSKFVGDKIRVQTLFSRKEVDISSVPRKKRPFIYPLRPSLAHYGRHCYMAGGLIVTCEETTMGSFCSLGRNVALGHGEHPLNFLTTSPYLYFDALGFKLDKAPSYNYFWDTKPIHIGNDVWIGDEVFVKNGVTIGDGAVLGARSVVTKDVPPYAIVAGVPAKIIRYRFDEPTRQELLRLKWWELDDDIIRQIPYDNISAALQFLREVRGK